jgi:hypothetical protein
VSFNEYEYQPTKSEYLKTTAGKVQLWSSAALVPVLIGAMFMDWFFISGLDGSTYGIKAFSTGFDFWVIMTILAVILSVGFSYRSPSRWGALLLAWFGTWWFLLASASLTSRDVFVEGVSLLYQLPDLLQNIDIPFIGSIQTYAFEVGAAWYVILASSILMISGSIAVLLKADSSN